MLGDESPELVGEVANGVPVPINPLRILLEPPPNPGTDPCFQWVRLATLQEILMKVVGEFFVLSKPVGQPEFVFRPQDLCARRARGSIGRPEAWLFHATFARLLAEFFGHVPQRSDSRRFPKQTRGRKIARPNYSPTHVSSPDLDHASGGPSPSHARGRAGSEPPGGPGRPGCGEACRESPGDQTGRRSEARPLCVDVSGRCE